MTRTALVSRLLKFGFAGLLLTGALAMRYSDPAPTAAQAPQQLVASQSSTAPAPLNTEWLNPPSLGNCKSLNGGSCSTEGHAIPCLPSGFCVCTKHKLDCN